MRASIREGEETTISKFLSGINLDIKEKVELLPYRDLNDLVQICIKVEQQHLRKGFKDKQLLEEEPIKNLWKEKTKRNQGKEHHHTPILETLSVLSVKGEVIFHPNALPRGP